MCPACISALALLAAKASSTGGAAALVAWKLRGKKDPKNPEPTPRADEPEEKETIR